MKDAYRKGLTLQRVPDSLYPARMIVVLRVSGKYAYVAEVDPNTRLRSCANDWMVSKRHLDSCYERAPRKGRRNNQET
jgi:hypothetical protein